MAGLLGHQRRSAALHDLLYSESADEAFEASREFGISLALVYATADETLFTVTGPLPVRQTPGGSVVPGDQVFDGSSPEAEWNGFVPYGESDWDGDGFLDDADVPQADETRDTSSAANQEIAYDTDHYIGHTSAGPERAKRIEDEITSTINAGDPIDLAFAEDMMLDVRDERAAAIVPDIVAVAEDCGDADLEAAAATLDAWDYRMTRDSEAALIFHQWLGHYRSSITGSPGAWVAVTLPPDSILFNSEDRQTKLLNALSAALADIASNGWSVYGDWNTTKRANHPFGDIVPQLNYPEIPVDGSAGTVNNFRAEFEPMFAAGATFRMAVDLEGPATTMLPGGNSGDPTSEHFIDQFEGFFNGQHRPMRSRERWATDDDLRPGG
ncbi:MAG: penicillin acylase family protein [Natrialbaceae archaeon]|nr:penicillin acylase family protein [Natrialbaceae archaeon]